VDNITKVLLAVCAIGLASALVLNGRQTASIVTAGGNAFSNSLKAAGA
jgi:hypothetical protein